MLVGGSRYRRARNRDRTCLVTSEPLSWLGILRLVIENTHDVGALRGHLASGWLGNRSDTWARSIFDRR